MRAIAPPLPLSLPRPRARIVLLALTPTPSFAVAVRCRQAQPFQNGDILHSNFYQPHVHVGSHLELALAANQSQLEPAHTAPNQSSHSSPSPLDPPPLIGEFDRIRADHEIVCAATPVPLEPTPPSLPHQHASDYHLHDRPWNAAVAVPMSSRAVPTSVHRAAVHSVFETCRPVHI